MENIEDIVNLELEEPILTEEEVAQILIDLFPHYEETTAEGLHGICKQLTEQAENHIEKEETTDQRDQSGSLLPVCRLSIPRGTIRDRQDGHCLLCDWPIRGPMPFTSGLLLLNGDYLQHPVY